MEGINSGPAGPIDGQDRDHADREGASCAQSVEREA